MAIDFSKFNKQIDKDKMEKDYEEALKNGGTGGYGELPDGQYEVAFEKLELGESKKGMPMVKVMMRVHDAVDCDDNDDAIDFFDNYKGKKKPCLFWNRVLMGTKNDANMIAGAVTWLNKMEPENPIVWNYDFEDLNEQILDLADDVCSDEGKDNGLMAIVEYAKDTFDSIKILEVYE